jgi:hypothetical protein
MNIPTSKSSRRPSTMILQVECIILKLGPADSRLESGRVCEKIRVVKNSADSVIRLTRQDQIKNSIATSWLFFLIFFLSKYHYFDL